MTTVAQQPPANSPLPYPKGILGKFVFKTPLLMIRLGLQPLMGSYFMVITHTGRKSGQARHTMTEMHPAKNGQLYAPCAYGERAQWYKNILADSRVTVQTAKRTFSAHARRVTDDDELLMVVDLLTRRNKFITTYLQRLGVENSPESIIVNKDKLYFITYDETHETTPPPLEPDLKWIWFVLPIVPLLIWLTKGR